MAELIEAAARSGQPARQEVMRTLSRIAKAAGTDWALGVQARAQALLRDNEDLYQAAIDYLGRSRARATWLAPPALRRVAPPREPPGRRQRAPS